MGLSAVAGGPRRAGGCGGRWVASAGSARLRGTRVPRMRRVLLGTMGPFPPTPCPLPAPSSPVPWAGRIFRPRRAGGMPWGGGELSSSSPGPRMASVASASGHQPPGHPGHRAVGQEGPWEGAPDPASKNFCGFERKKKALRPRGAAAPVCPAPFLLFFKIFFFLFFFLNLLLSPRPQRR